MASCHSCVAANRGFLRCRTAAGAVVLHIGLFSVIGALVCASYMLLRSTKFLTTSSNLTVPYLARMASTSSCEASDAGRFSMSFVSINNKEKAESLAKKLIENHLAACVQIIPSVTSVYSWKGKTEVDNELLMVIKSRVSRLDDMTKFVVKNHPYEICEVTSVPVSCKKMSFNQVYDIFSFKCKYSYCMEIQSTSSGWATMFQKLPHQDSRIKSLFESCRNA